MSEVLPAGIRPCCSWRAWQCMMLCLSLKGVNAKQVWRAHPVRNSEKQIPVRRKSLELRAASTRRFVLWTLWACLVATLANVLWG